MPMPMQMTPPLAAMLGPEDWVHSSQKRARVWANAGRLERLVAEIRDSADELGRAHPELFHGLRLQRSLDYFLKPKSAPPAWLLASPCLHGWLFAIRRLLDAGSTECAAEQRVLLAQFHGFAATLAAQRGDPLEITSVLDQKGHFHFRGLRAYLDFGTAAAGKPMQLAFALGALQAGSEGVGTATLQSELLLEGRTTPSPGCDGPNVARFGDIALRWHPAVTMTIEVADCDPLLMPLESPAGPSEHAVAVLSAQEMARFVFVLRRGIEEIAAVDSQLATELSDGIKVIVPLERGDPDRHVSSTYSHLPGAIFLCHDDNPILQAETLVHEFCHNKLNALMEMQPLFENEDEKPIFYSPWRNDPRTLKGLLLGAHAFLNVARFLSGAAHVKRQPRIKTKLQTEAAMRCLQVEPVLEVLQAHGKLAEMGRSLVGVMRKSLRRIISGLPPQPGGIWGAAKEPVEKHARRYRKNGSFYHKETSG